LTGVEQCELISNGPVSMSVHPLKRTTACWSTSRAVPSSLQTAYDSARSRHPNAQWLSNLGWFDFLNLVVRAEPVTVTGAFNFGLKAIASAMHSAGLIATTWLDGPTDWEPWSVRGGATPQRAAWGPL